MRNLCLVVILLLSFSGRVAAYEIVAVDRIDAYRGANLSADGRVVVGTASDAVTGDLDPIRWTRDGGAVSLGKLSGYPSTGATGVSDDGTVVVGYGIAPSSATPYEAYRWTMESGMAGLGTLPGLSSLGTVARGVSGDGSTVVGLTSAGARGFVYSTHTATMTSFIPAEGVTFIMPISADGQVVAFTDSGRESSKAFLWTPSSGIEELEGAPTEWTRISVLSISADGTQLLGSGGPGGAAFTTPFLWSRATGFVPLTAPGEASFRDMTPDASVLIGDRVVDGVSIPAVWDAEHGTRLLHDVLAGHHGFRQEDLNFDYARDISADQRTLFVRAGAGLLSQFSVIYLDKPLVTPVPEPGTWVMAVAGVVAAALRRRPGVTRNANVKSRGR